MKSSLTHLPASKQNEIAQIVRTLREEYERFTSTKNGRRGQCRLLKIILFGSHATGGWVKDPAHGYLSDYDILVILNRPELVDEWKIWGAAEDRITLQIQPPISLLVHTLEEVNEALTQGQYFFTDIRRDGIVLYESDNRELAHPGNLTPSEAAEVAQKHFDHWFESACEFFLDYEAPLQRGNYKNAAFLLHQVTERLYACLLLVLTNYKPNTHNLTQLNALAIEQDERLAEVFPRKSKLQRRRFQKLKRAYVDARYSEHYEIAPEDLQWLSDRVHHLRDLTQTICTAKITSYTTL